MMAPDWSGSRFDSASCGQTPSAEPSRTVRTVCPRNCYCTCGMLVTVEGGRITRIEGDPRNPATGGAVCLKGLSYARRVSSPHRLLVPQRRKRRGDGFEAVSWETALDGIVAALDDLRRRYGPQSVLYYEGSGSHGALSDLAFAFWWQYGGCTLTYGDLCWPAGLEATRLTYGENRHSHPRLTTESRFILLWGHNPAETNVHQWRLILEARERGARLAVVDPRSTETTDAADLHVKPRPGTDAALALGLARCIVEQGLHDEAFLASHAVGTSRFLERVREYPLRLTAEITGVPEGILVELATAYARTRPALLIAGFGVQRHRSAGQTLRAVACLPALIGSVGLAGGGFQYANLTSHCLRPPQLPPEPAGVRRALPVSRLGRLTELEDPPIRGLWVERGNPVSQSPRSGLLEEALGGLELVVVVDQHLSDTARCANWILPAKSLFEEQDLVTAYWHPYIQLRQKILEPPGEVKTETEIWRLLSRRLGLDTRLFPDDPTEILKAMLPGDPPDLWERLHNEPVDPSGRGDIAFAERSFRTPSGRVELASQEAARLWRVDPVPGYTSLREGHEAAATGAPPLQLLTCKTRDRIHSQFGQVDWIREVERPHHLDIHPRDAALRGLEDGDRARVQNDRGSVEAVVRIDHGLRPGVVHILEGRCHEADPAVNLLTDDGVTDMGYGATFYECLVEVSRA